MTPYERVKMVLDDRGLIPNDLQKMCGFSSGVMSQWKSGVEISGKSAMRIAEALNIPVGWILTGELQKEEKNPLEFPREERELLSKIRSLSPKYREMLETYVDFLIASDAQERKFEGKLSG